MSQAALNTFRIEFAQRLRSLRVPRGYRTARSFAHALGIDENRYTRYERAEVEPDLALLARMCTLLGVTPNELLGFPVTGTDDAAGEPGQTSHASAGSFQHANKGREPAAHNARGLAWQIACQLTRQTVTKSNDINPLDELRLTLKLFNEIEADPFSFVRRAPELPAMSALPSDRQAEVVAALNEMLAVAEDNRT